MTTITIKLPTNANLPTGYRYGAHITGSTWYLIREDGADIRVEQRPDYEMDEDEVEEAITEAFDELDALVETAREEAEAEALSAMESECGLHVGAQIEAGAGTEEGADTGRVLGLRRRTDGVIEVDVGWDSGVRTWGPADLCTLV